MRVFNTFDPNDIVDQEFGKLIVKAYFGKELRGKKTWQHVYDCDCGCGKIRVKATRALLKSGDKISCGCAHQDAGDARLEDLTGRVFDRWKVIERAPDRVSKSGKSRSVMWVCECECGTRKSVGARALKTGMSTSCGCFQKERVSETLTDDLTGREFAHLKVKYRNGSYYPKNYRVNGKRGGVRAVWHCECDCGNECDVTGELLKNGDVTSCGCSRTSKYELYVLTYLESIGYIRDTNFFKEKAFPGLVGIGGGSLRFDFFVKSRSGEDVLIECQGERHVRATKWFGGEEYLNRLNIHDGLKRDFAKAYGIRLIEISHKKVSYEVISKYLISENVI